MADEKNICAVARFFNRGSADRDIAMLTTVVLNGLLTPQSDD